MIERSKDYLNYLKAQKHERIKILIWQVSLLIGFIGLWEALARVGIVNTFLLSSPSEIGKLLLKYMKDGSLFVHIGVSVWETILGFSIGTVLGVGIAIILWWSELLAKILDPALVVLNALPKTALAPIIIVWAGAGIGGIVVTAVMISIVTTILSVYNDFKNMDEEKIKMLKSFGATKAQVLVKLILPANLCNMINVVKINIGLAWVGVIVGEFIVSRNGLGYLIVYGGQVFRLDLVMMGVVVLGFCAFMMYSVVNCLEKRMMKKRVTK